MAIPENWPATDTYEPYGGPTNLWGTTWTSTDINSSGFRVAIKAAGAGTGSEVCRVDHVRITVYYSGGGACTVNGPKVEFLEAPKTITTDNGSVTYNVKITNQDSGAGCTNPLTINLSSSTTGSFTSSLSQASVSLAPGANTTINNLVTVTEVAATNGQTTTTTITASATGHTSGTAQVVTTYSV